MYRYGAREPRAGDQLGAPGRGGRRRAHGGGRGSRGAARGRGRRRRRLEQERGHTGRAGEELATDPIETRSPHASRSVSDLRGELGMPRGSHGPRRTASDAARPCRRGPRRPAYPRTSACCSYAVRTAVVRASLRWGGARGRSWRWGRPGEPREFEEELPCSASGSKFGQRAHDAEHLAQPGAARPPHTPSRERPPAGVPLARDRGAREGASPSEGPRTGCGNGIRTVGI